MLIPDDIKVIHAEPTEDGFPQICAKTDRDGGFCVIEPSAFMAVFSLLGHFNLHANTQDLRQAVTKWFDEHPETSRY